MTPAWLSVATALAAVLARAPDARARTIRTGAPERPPYWRRRRARPTSRTPLWEKWTAPA